MARSKRTIRVYWLQFVMAAVWVGVVEVLIRGRISPEIFRFIIDILVILTGILAFEPVGKHIFKYLIVSVGASLLIQALRRVGIWYMSANHGTWRIGGPVIALAIITALLYSIGIITQKDKLKF